MLNRLLWIILMSVLISGCGDGVVTDSDSRLKGVYFYDDDYSVLQLCSDGSEYWIVVNDELRGVIARANLKPMQGLYLELKGKMGMPVTEGEGAHYESVFVVSRVEHFSTDISKSGCGKELKMSDELTGESPRKWRLNFEGNDIRFQSWNTDTLLFFPNNPPIIHSNGKREYHIMNEGGVVMDLIIEEKNCELGGRKFPLSCGLKISKIADTFSGCGRPRPEKIVVSAKSN